MSSAPPSSFVIRHSSFSPAIFLTAEWRYLAFLNYEVDPAVLAPLVPSGTELDDRDGRHFVSMVGFRFLRTRVCGIPFPFHQNFDEVNLRFYVRRRVPGQDGWRRGTVFVREVVPRWFISTTARWLYNEPYLACPMTHSVRLDADATQTEYRWKYADRWQTLAVDAAGGEPSPIEPGTETDWITDHFWGYNRQRNGGTMEYEVEHPRWRYWPGRQHRFDCDVAKIYGPGFVPFLAQAPSSAFVVEGSSVSVRRGTKVR